MIDVSKLRKGDIVHVRARVTSIGKISIDVDISGDLINAPYDEFVAVEPRPIRDGDRVQLNPGGDDYEVLAIHGDKAWLRHPDGFHITADISAITRVY